MSFIATIQRARSLLERSGRLSLRVLKLEFELNDEALDALVEELVDVQQVAACEGKVLSWMGSARAETSAPHPAAHTVEGVSSEQVTSLDVAEAERRQLTVMFCDLVGSTDLGQRLDAEDLRSVVRAYQEAASGAIQRHAGHIAQYLGDGLLVYFGHPQAHEDDAERAVRAGLEILTALRTLNDTLEPKYEIRLAARVGIHTGPVVVGEMGGGARSEVLALGDTPNIAARLEAIAEPDTVVMSSATQQLVAGLFVVEDHGPQRLKGVREPMTLYRVVQPSGVRSRLDVAAGRLTRFVGREAELATLVDRWERAADGEGQNVLVLGEAGVGKSRLVYELHEHLTAVRHTWLECGATPYTEGTPFHPVIALLAQGLAFAPEDTAAERLGKLEVGLGTLASAETVALLADFLGLPPPTRLQLSPELQRRKTIELLAQWNLAMSEVQPLVLFVEDLHWCDVSTLELLGHLITQSPTARVLLLATARPEFTPPWPARSNLSTVQLARLTKRQARDMVAALGGPELPADTLDALVAHADGVPLYVEELTKAMAEPGVAQGVEGIPASLADSLMGRLDRLSAAKEVAQRAAVLGREFGYPLLAATVGMDEAALRHGLARLVDAEILFARGEPPTATYTFKHALIQETAYQSQLKRTRQQLHARVAKVLEERFPERVAVEPELVARHYDQAGLAAQASAHYQRAGERAMRRSANEEAIGHLRRALALVATLPETRERHQMELGLQMAVGAPLSAARGWSHPETEQTFARARALASQIGESPELPRVLAGMTIAYGMKGDLATGVEVAQEALAAAERTGEPFDLLLAHLAAGGVFFQGHFSRALQHFEQSIGFYNPSVHACVAHTVGFDYGVVARGFAAWCQVYLGHPDRASGLSEAAVALAKQVGHPLSLADALLHAGLVHSERGELDRMRERAEEVVGLSEQLGFPLYLGMGRFVRGWERVKSGEGEAGLAEMQQALVELAGIGSGIGAPGFLSVLAEGLLKVGRHADALGALSLGVAQAGQQGQHFWDAELHRLRAEILLDKNGNAASEAEALFRQSIEIAQRQEAKTFELRAATRLARLWQRQGKRDAAHALLAPLYAWFTEGFGTRDLKEAKALLDALS
ncbi:MAG TPA: adenylate/guanylate cyclase domain-containing protein [Myxococcota bacterium]|nr:adenylate/guanylate cyclase domain-containing protein [Myxococcota bacterium]